MTWEGLLAATVLIPTALACVTAVTRGPATTVVGFVSTLISALLALATAARVTLAGPLEHQLAGWAPPLGITLRADGLTAILLGLTAIVGSLTACYAATRSITHGGDRRFWPLLLLLWAGIAGVALSGDLFNLYVALEVVTLSAVGLVALGGRDALEPALRYLLVAVFGSMLYLLAVAMIYGMTGTLDLQEAGALIAADPSADTRWPLALAVVGLGIKAALLPLHAWLPPAHAAAPAAVSPLLSALVVKAGFIVTVRLWFDVLGPDAAVAAALGGCAAAAVLGAGLLALVQRRLKRVVAYSTVAQVGYLYLLFPLTAATDDPAVQRLLWGGAMTMLVAHGVAKAALFLAAGSLKLSAGTDDLDGIVGAARHLGTLSLTMMLTGISLVGLPISLGFAGKWLLLSGALGAGQWWAVLVVLVGSLLAAAYLLRPVAAVLRDSDEHEEVGRAELHTLPWALRYLPLALALLAIVLGLSARWLSELSLIGSSLGGMP
ncbi:complex I subunit 5 family protein [Ornithinimicrobium sp. Y1694]|uniref:complex I subunit 5 family protein n=1 Tax=Ornithinimicrobium sp. Y1694 TaxID=3418590 RepID=UPI003CF5FCAA